MLSCRELTELASDYLDGKLGWQRRIGVRMHLWMCTNCRRYIEQMRRVVGLLKLLPDEPPPEVAEALLARFRTERGAST